MAARAHAAALPPVFAWKLADVLAPEIACVHVAASAAASVLGPMLVRVS